MNNSGFTGMMSISDEEFRSIRDLVYDKFGINLTEQKRSLVVGRLQKVLRELRIPTFREYYEHVVQDQAALSDLVNHISTNHTFFFREGEHFDFFRQVVLPEACERHSADKDLRFWCAAASSGEEPYTIVISMLEHFRREYTNWNAGLLATDISRKTLDIALHGVYPQERLQLVSPELRDKYFKEISEGMFEVSQKLKDEVVYRRFNLMNERLPFKKKFDAIFCRNVMIYFDQPTRLKLVNRLYNVTVPGGYLFIGHSETLGRDRTPWKYIKPAVYRKEL